jgi:twitching motility two-component system response regulator PilH
MTIKNILIVDDSRTELLYLADMLMRRGYSVKTANNAEDALRLIAGERPDLLLLDVVMPGLNGFQLTRQLTKDPASAEIPIILCTSKNQEADRVWGLRQGAKDYILKPVNENILLSKIKAL